jgi:NADH-quinone oxidoreductase subunit H
VWILAIFSIRTWRTTGGSVTGLLIGLGIALAVLLLVAFLVPERKVAEPGVELASDYPVPDLTLEVPKPSRHKLRRRQAEREQERTPALSGKENE